MRNILSADNINNEYWDVICIGSGMSSLTYALTLTNQDPSLKILILEKHDIPGGYCSEFLRPKLKARFDCSLHKLSGMGAEGNLRKVFRELKIEKDINFIFSPLLFEAIDDSSLSISSDFEVSYETLCEEFPKELEGLKRFHNDVIVHGKNAYMQFETMQCRFEPNIKDLRYAHRTLKNINVYDALQERFTDQKLIELLSLPTIYIGAYPEQCSYLYFLHVVYASHHQKSAYVGGGGQYLSNLLTNKIEQSGGKVQLKTTVTKVLIEDNNMSAIGVETTNGNFYSRNVVINAAPLYALNQLFDPRPELEKFLQNASNQQAANSTTTIYIVLDCAPEACGLNHAETMILSDNPAAAFECRELSRLSPHDSGLAEKAYWLLSSIEVTNYRALDSSGGNVIILNVLDDMHHWPVRKTPEYRAKKKRSTKILLQRLYDRLPNLSEHVKYTEISTPHTYQRYTNNTAGSGYGALVAPNASTPPINNQFPIAGINFLSAWVSGASYEGVMGYSFMMANANNLLK